MSLRVSLSAFLIASGIVGGVVGTVGRKWYIASAERQLRHLGVKTFDVLEFESWEPGHAARLESGIILAVFEDVPVPKRAEALRLAGRIPHLAGISFMDCPGTIDLRQLRSCNHVRLLEISGATELTNADVLARFPQLSRLLIRDNLHVGDTLASLTSSCPHVRSLDLSWTAVTDDGVQRLCENLELSELWVRDAQLTSLSFLIVGRCQELRVLDLSRSGFFYGDAELRKLGPDCQLNPLSSELRRLVHRVSPLEFRRLVGRDQHRPLRPDPVPAAKFPPALVWLDGGGWRFEKPVFESLAELEHLEYLNLSGQSLTLRELSPLRRSKSLRRLGLADTNVGDDEVTLMSEIGTLEAVDLRGTSVRARGILALAASHRLKRLYLDLVSEGNRRCLADMEGHWPRLKDKEVVVEYPRYLEQEARHLTQRASVSVRATGD
jgi:hypothetical protein